MAIVLYRDIQYLDGNDALISGATAYKPCKPGANKNWSKKRHHSFAAGSEKNV